MSIFSFLHKKKSKTEKKKNFHGPPDSSHPADPARAASSPTAFTALQSEMEAYLMQFMIAVRSRNTKSVEQFQKNWVTVYHKVFKWITEEDDPFLVYHMMVEVVAAVLVSQLLPPVMKSAFGSSPPQGPSDPSPSMSSASRRLPAHSSSLHKLSTPTGVRSVGEDYAEPDGASCLDECSLAYEHFCALRQHVSRIFQFLNGFVHCTQAVAEAEKTKTSARELYRASMTKRDCGPPPFYDGNGLPTVSSMCNHLFYAVVWMPVRDILTEQLTHALRTLLEESQVELEARLQSMIQQEWPNFFSLQENHAKEESKEDIDCFFIHMLCATHDMLVHSQGYPLRSVRFVALQRNLNNTHSLLQDIDKSQILFDKHEALKSSAGVRGERGTSVNVRFEALDLIQRFFMVSLNQRKKENNSGPPAAVNAMDRSSTSLSTPISAPSSSSRQIPFEATPPPSPPTTRGDTTPSGSSGVIYEALACALKTVWKERRHSTAIAGGVQAPRVKDRPVFTSSAKVDVPHLPASWCSFLLAYALGMLTKSVLGPFIDLSDPPMWVVCDAGLRRLSWDVPPLGWPAVGKQWTAASLSILEVLVERWTIEQKRPFLKSTKKATDERKKREPSKATLPSEPAEEGERHTMEEVLPPPPPVDQKILEHAITALLLLHQAQEGPKSTAQPASQLTLLLSSLPSFSRPSLDLIIAVYRKLLGRLLHSLSPATVDEHRMAPLLQPGIKKTIGRPSSSAAVARDKDAVRLVQDIHTYFSLFQLLLQRCLLNEMSEIDPQYRLHATLALENASREMIFEADVGGAAAARLNRGPHPPRSMRLVKLSWAKLLVRIFFQYGLLHERALSAISRGGGSKSLEEGSPKIRLLQTCTSHYALVACWVRVLQLSPLFEKQFQLKLLQSLFLPPAPSSSSNHYHSYHRFPPPRGEIEYYPQPPAGLLSASSAEDEPVTPFEAQRLVEKLVLARIPVAHPTILSWFTLLHHFEPRVITDSLRQLLVSGQASSSSPVAPLLRVQLIHQRYAQELWPSAMAALLQTSRLPATGVDTEGGTNSSGAVSSGRQTWVVPTLPLQVRQALNRFAGKLALVYPVRQWQWRHQVGGYAVFYAEFYGELPPKPLLPHQEEKEASRPPSISSTTPPLAPSRCAYSSFAATIVTANELQASLLYWIGEATTSKDCLIRTNSLDAIGAGSTSTLNPTLHCGGITGTVLAQKLGVSFTELQPHLQVLLEVGRGDAEMIGEEDGVTEAGDDVAASPFSAHPADFVGSLVHEGLITCQVPSLPANSFVSQIFSETASGSGAMVASARAVEPGVYALNHYFNPPFPSPAIAASMEAHASSAAPSQDVGAMSCPLHAGSPCRHHRHLRLQLPPLPLAARLASRFEAASSPVSSFYGSGPVEDNEASSVSYVGGSTPRQHSSTPVARAATAGQHLPMPYFHPSSSSDRSERAEWEVKPSPHAVPRQVHMHRLKRKHSSQLAAVEPSGLGWSERLQVAVITLLKGEPKKKEEPSANLAHAPAGGGGRVWPYTELQQAIFQRFGVGPQARDSYPSVRLSRDLKAATEKLIELGYVRRVANWEDVQESLKMPVEKPICAGPYIILVA